MTAVALIGGDGAGKTTVAEELVRSFPYPVRRLYMGVNPASARFSLPTTRLLHAATVRRAGAEGANAASLHTIGHRKNTRGRLWAAARLVNRIAEESLRQVMSWWYQARGEIVVSDRHFLFDYTPALGRPRRLSTRIHLWFLEHLYPKPDLVILLDAPSSVLLARKQEVPEKYLDARRAAFLRRGAGMRNFEIVDAGRPLHEVSAEVARRLERSLSPKETSEEHQHDEDPDREQDRTRGPCPAGRGPRRRHGG